MRDRGFKWILVLVVSMLLAGSLDDVQAGKKKKVTRGSDGKFAEVTAEEKSLTEVPGEENAAAVILFHKGNVRLMDTARSVLSSTLQVETRIKVLTEAGMEYAEWTFSYHEDFKLRKLEARTVLPNGTVVPVEANAIFERESKTEDSSSRTVAIAFPSVEPGAILDYRYEILVDGYFAPPWQFQDELPTIYSEVEYLIPSNITVEPWGRTTFNRQMQNDLNRTPRGRILRVWMENLPAIPDEPYSYPIFDLSSQFDLTLTEDKKYRYKLFTDWDTTCARYKDMYYRDARKKSKLAKEKVAEIVAGVSGPRETAKALYRFVRDEIAIERLEGVNLAEDATLDQVMEDKKGDYAEKALLLEMMLREANLRADLVWTRSRFDGMPDLSVAKPNWFDRAVVRLLINGETVFLDPGDRRYAFGWGRAGAEGMKAVAMPGKGDPEIIELPMSAPADNLRRSQITLDIDEDGITTGTGTLTLSGHPARRKMEWKASEELTREAWRDWLGDRLAGFEVRQVAVQEERDEGRIIVSWEMAQPEEIALGDEVSLNAAMPLGPVDTPFTLLTSQRRTPVLLGYRSRNETELTVHWAEGFMVDAQPESLDYSSEAGSFSASVELSPEGNSLTFKRVFEEGSREYLPGRDYGRLRSLYRKMSKSDARPIVIAVE